MFSIRWQYLRQVKPKEKRHKIVRPRESGFPSLLKFSAGSLIGPHNASAQGHEDGIKIIWTTNFWAGLARPHDKALVVTINLEKDVYS